VSDLLERTRKALEAAYVVEREVGRGGMAVVYLARDLKHDRKVALKVLNPDLAATIGGERFLREVRTAAQLDHPHILPVFDSGATDGLLYYAMPFVEGATLGERLDREGQLPIDDVIQIAVEIAGALQHAHDRGVVHRDVKPGNILFRAGHAQLADFGVARAAEGSDGTSLTQTGTAVGTPLYMSPEQAAGSGVDARSDQYSLASVVYECLCGEPPFTGPSARSILARKMSEPPSSIATTRPSAASGIEPVVRRALDPTPADRFRSVTTFAEALAEASGAQVGPAAPTLPAASPTPARSAESPAPSARKRLRPGPTGLIALAVVVLALIAVGLASLGSGDGGIGPSTVEAADVPGIAVLPFGFIGPDSADSYVSDAAAMKLAEAFQHTGVRSPGWPAVKRFRDSMPDAARLGEELKVGYLLQGDIFLRGSEMELSVWLTRAHDGAVMWQRTFTGLTGELREFEVQVAQTAIDSVALYAGLPVGRLTVRRYTEDDVADSLYTRALYLANQTADPDSTRVIIDLAERAIERDSAFAPAYVLLAYALGEESRAWWRVPPRDRAPQVRELLETAIEIAPDMVDARYWYGWYYYVFAWEWEAAEALFEQAIDLDPGSYWPRTMLAFPLVVTGNTDSAIATAQAASALEPYNPMAVSTECWILYLAHRFTEATDRCQFVLDSIEANHNYAVWIGATSRFALRFLEGDLSPTEAQEEIEAQLANLPPVDERFLFMEISEALRLAQLGASDTARAIIEEEIGRPGFRPLRAANVYAAIGDMDEAWKWLERAYKAGDPFLAESSVRPEMAPFRDDPRWAEFARRMNLD
jgi:tetratricopeptide (TPR) repeat protein/TolB-like protein/tRNA A-37 threonylcarbamoyl transferase component Bud32